MAIEIAKEEEKQRLSEEAEKAAVGEGEEEE